MDKERTSREWFEMVEDKELREKMLESFNSSSWHDEEDRISCLSSAIFGLNWANTSGGHDFWRKVYNEANEDLIPLVYKTDDSFKVGGISVMIADRPPPLDPSHTNLIKKTILSVDSNY